MEVIVPVDDSSPARTALEHALERYPDANITALHVLNPSVAAYGVDNPHNFEQAFDAEKEKAEALFDTLEELGDEHGVSIRTETISGSPAPCILEYAENNDADQIVIGSHGRSGMARVLLGSVAEQVVRRASMPVTVVR